MSKKTEFKDVAHHYLISKVRIKVYRVGKTYADGEFEAITTFNYTHIELIKGGQFVIIPELKDWRDMTDQQVIEMAQALDAELVDLLDSTKSSFANFTVTIKRDSDSYSVSATSAKGDLPVAYLSLTFAEVADYLRDNGYDIHGLIEAGRAVKV